MEQIRQLGNLVQGAGSGFVVSLIFQPIEVVKTAYFLHWEKTGSFMRLLRFIRQTDGLPGFWNGVVPTALRSAASSGVYFSTLRWLQSHQGERSAVRDGLNSMVSRSAIAVLLNPLTILELRSQIPGHHPYRHAIHGFYSILLELRLRSFTQGIVPVLWKEGSFASIYYSLYMELKQFGQSSFLSGMLAGLVATVASHPFELVRARMQAGAEFASIPGAGSSLPGSLRAIFRAEGWGGVLRGVAMRLLKKPLVNTLTFVLFEKASAQEKSD